MGGKEGEGGREGGRGGRGGGREGGLTCRTFLSSPSGNTRGSSVIFEAVDMPCPVPFHLPHIADDFSPLPDPGVGLSILVYVMLNILKFILVCAAASCFRLVSSCLVSAHLGLKYVYFKQPILGLTQEFYWVRTCVGG